MKYIYLLQSLSFPTQRYTGVTGDLDKAELDAKDKQFQAAVAAAGIRLGATLRRWKYARSNRRLLRSGSDAARLIASIFQPVPFISTTIPASLAVGYVTYRTGNVAVNNFRLTKGGQIKGTL